MQDYINQTQLNLQQPKCQQYQKKTKSEIDLIRNQNIQKIEKAYDRIVNIEDETNQDNQIHNEKKNKILNNQNQDQLSNQLLPEIIEQLNPQTNPKKE